jgi:tRNA(Ile2) C34 agmatinyltransferase TiaS
MKYLPFLLLAIIATTLPLSYYLEKKSYNKGFCPICSYRLKLFGRDSHGGRGYRCDNCNYYTWVSYHSVDKY